MSRVKAYDPVEYTSNPEQYSKNGNGIYSTYSEYHYQSFYIVPLEIEKQYEEREDGVYTFECLLPAFNEAQLRCDDSTLYDKDFSLLGGFDFWEANLNSDSSCFVELTYPLKEDCENFREYIFSNDKWDISGTYYRYSECVSRNEKGIDKKLMTTQLISDRTDVYNEYDCMIDGYLAYCQPEADNYVDHIKFWAPGAEEFADAVSKAINEDSLWSIIKSKIDSLFKYSVDIYFKKVTLRIRGHMYMQAKPKDWRENAVRIVYRNKEYGMTRFLLEDEIDKSVNYEQYKEKMDWLLDNLCAGNIDECIAKGILLKVDGELL